LGVAAEECEQRQEPSSSSDDDVTVVTKYALCLEGEALIEDTSEVDDGDDLVLMKIGGGGDEEEKSSSGVGKQQEEEEKESLAATGGDGGAKSKPPVVESKTKAPLLDEDYVVDPHAFVGRRIAKFFDDTEQWSFGNVLDFRPADETEDYNRDLWQVAFDDGDVEDFTLQEVKNGIAAFAKKQTSGSEARGR
jgi:hypothetical protein